VPQRGQRDAGGVTSGVWFPGEVDGGPEADAFLEQVRKLAPRHLADRVRPEDTAAVRYGCLLTVEVPGVPKREWPVYTHLLQVMWQENHLGGYWGCSHLWDEYDPTEPSALDEAGRQAPDQAAAKATRWLAEQLHRPLVVEEWDRPLTSRPIRRWVLADTGDYVAGRRRRPPGAPDRIVSLWPPAGQI
jgi:hypothetical protein